MTFHNEAEYKEYCDLYVLCFKAKAEAWLYAAGAPWGTSRIYTLVEALTDKIAKERRYFFPPVRFAVWPNDSHCPESDIEEFQRFTNLGDDYEIRLAIGVDGGEDPIFLPRNFVLELIQDGKSSNENI